MRSSRGAQQNAITFLIMKSLGDSVISASRPKMKAIEDASNPRLVRCWKLEPYDEFIAVG